MKNGHGNYGTALVTGASSGIGRGLALALAARGTFVVVAARRQSELDHLCAEIARAGGQAEPLVLDVSDGDATYEAVRELDGRRPLDLVIANAGVGQITPGTRLRWDHVKLVLETNLTGAAATLCGAIPGMVERRRGHVVGVASLAGFRGLPRFAAYSGSKSGMITFLESLRVDLAASGVAVTSICPGFVRTPMTAGSQPPFLVELDDAVATMLRAIDQKQAVCAFPAQWAAPLVAIRHLPAAVYQFVASRTAARVKY
jgi:short-subunit dehydrogenase